MFNHDLIKKSESYFCQKCETQSLADKVYKLRDLPNNLLLTFVYRSTDTSKNLRLRNYMEVDMSPFVQTKFYDTESNPFHNERPDQFKYKLTSLITYNHQEPTRDGYITFTQTPDGQWIKFAKYTTSFVTQQEVEDVRFPSVLIFSRSFEVGNERSNIRSQLEILEMNGYGPEVRPIPDFWVLKAVHLYSPGRIYLSHYLCKHLKLKPTYKDVFLRARRQEVISAVEEEFLANAEQAEEEETESSVVQPAESGTQKTPTKSLDSKSESTVDSKPEPKIEDVGVADLGSYTEYAMQVHSTYLPTPIAEYIIERFCEDMDLETYRKLNFEEVCSECLTHQKKLLKRRIFERQLVQKYETTVTDLNFVISLSWLSRWKIYLCVQTEEDKFKKHYFFDSFELPGPIENKGLLTDDSDLTSGVREDLLTLESAAPDKGEQPNPEYFVVNSYIMELLNTLYGCDVVIGRQGKLLSDPEASLPTKSQFNSEDLQVIEELRKIIQDDKYEVEDEEIYQLWNLKNNKHECVSVQLLEDEPTEDSDVVDLEELAEEEDIQEAARATTNHQGDPRPVLGAIAQVYKQNAPFFKEDDEEPGQNQAAEEDEKIAYDNDDADDELPEDQVEPEQDQEDPDAELEEEIDQEYSNPPPEDKSAEPVPETPVAVEEVGVKVAETGVTEAETPANPVAEGEASSKETKPAAEGEVEASGSALGGKSEKSKSGGGKFSLKSKKGESKTTAGEASASVVKEEGERQGEKGQVQAEGQVQVEGQVEGKGEIEDVGEGERGAVEYGEEGEEESK